MIWILGSRGLLGSELRRLLEAGGIPHLATGRELSILELEALEAFSRGRDIDWILNCAAYSAVDRAEAEPEAAFELNARGPELLGLLAGAIGARLIHLSTDYVFDGQKEGPYPEEEPVSPLSVYGRSKAEGERLLLQAAPDSIVLRSSWLFGGEGKSFLSALPRRLAAGEGLRVEARQRSAPTWIRDLALAILALTQGQQVPGGIYHYAGEGGTTRFEFARELLSRGRALGLFPESAQILPLPEAEGLGGAPRPASSVLGMDKIKRLGVRTRTWREALRAYLGELAAGREGGEAAEF